MHIKKIEKIRKWNKDTDKMRIIFGGCVLLFLGSLDLVKSDHFFSSDGKKSKIV